MKKEIRNATRTSSLYKSVTMHATFILDLLPESLLPPILSDLYFRLQLDFSTSIIRLPELEKSGFTVIKRGSFDIPLTYFFFTYFK